MTEFLQVRLCGSYKFIWNNILLRSNSAMYFQLAQACRILSYLMTFAGIVWMWSWSWLKDVISLTSLRLHCSQDFPAAACFVTRKLLFLKVAEYSSLQLFSRLRVLLVFLLSRYIAPSEVVVWHFCMITLGPCFGCPFKSHLQPTEEVVISR